MPTKERYQQGHRGRGPRSAATGPSRLLKLLGGSGGRSHNTSEAAADWGGDGTGEGSEQEGNPARNGGMRFFRAIDAADREDRIAQGKDRLKYSWRSITGPTPDVERGDLLAARAYLAKLDAAIDRGGWTSSEASGLYLAKQLWKRRAQGNDPRYNEVGNRKGGLTKQETANVEQRRIVMEMRRTLEASGRHSGD